MASEDKSQISKKEKPTKVGIVQSLDDGEVKKATQINYAQRGDEFQLRDQNRRTVRKLEKTATSKSPKPHQSRRLRDQKKETQLRLNPPENAGIRVGPKRTEETDRKTLQERERIQKLKATTKQAKQDVDRHLIKLQRRCHHKFNKSTGKCELCDKPRSAHI